MANDANIRAVITADDRASKVLSKFGDHVNNEAQRASSGFDNFTKRIAIGATIANLATSAIARGVSLITDSIGEAVSRVDTLNNANRTFANMGFTVKETKKAMDDLLKSILGLPTSLNDAVTDVELLASSTNNIGKATKLFKALNDGILGFGGSAEQVHTAVIQLSQAFSGGVVHAQDWNSMLNAGLGPALNAIAKQMGMTIGALKDGLSTGSVSVEDFQNRLIALDEKGGGGLKSLQKIVRDSTSGMATGMANAKTAIVRGLADIIKAFGSANISAAITGIGTAAESALKSLAGLVGAIKNMADNVSNYLGPKLDAIWSTIKNNFIPAVSGLITALGPTAGVGLVAILGLTIDWLNAFLKIITPVLNFLKDNTWIVWGVVGAFVAFKTALAIEKAVAAFQAALLILNGAMIQSGGVAGGLRLVMLSLLGPWEIALAIVGVAEVIAGIKLVADELDTLLNKWNRNAKVGLPNSKIQVSGNSDIGLTQQLMNAFKGFGHNAAGTDNWRGGPTWVGEQGPELVNLPQGSQVIPNNKIGQSQSTTISVNLNAGAFLGSDVEARKFAQTILGHLKDTASSKNMSVAQMLGV